MSAPRGVTNEEARCSGIVHAALNYRRHGSFGICSPRMRAAAEALDLDALAAAAGVGLDDAWAKGKLARELFLQTYIRRS